MGTRDRICDFGSFVLVAENVGAARKAFADAGLDYDRMIAGKKDWAMSPKFERALMQFVKVKGELEKSNNLGYLVVFAKMFIENIGPNWGLASDGTSLAEALELLRANKDIISNLRDPSGRKVSIFDLPTGEAVVDALTRLADWRKVNAFMRRIPPTQKALLWADGYWAPGVAHMSGFLTKCILDISKDQSAAAQFLSKVSSIKTPKQMVDAVGRLSRTEMWDFDYWTAKLNRTRNALITWSSREEGKIVCVVLTHRALTEVAYMTNWCIVRSKSMFRDYAGNGMQCVLYDFGLPASDNLSVVGFSLNDPLDPRSITACHDKADNALDGFARLRQLGIEGNWYKKLRFWSGLYGGPSAGGHLISKDSRVGPEIVRIDLARAARKMDSTIVRVFLSSPWVARFLNLYG